MNKTKTNVFTFTVLGVFSLEFINYLLFI